jgi:hypothetical protein
LVIDSRDLVEVVVFGVHLLLEQRISKTTGGLVPTRATAFEVDHNVVRCPGHDKEHVVRAAGADGVTAGAEDVHPRHELVEGRKPNLTIIVGIGVGVSITVCVGIDIAVGVTIGVHVSVAVAVTIAVTVTVAVAVAVTISVTVAVTVAVAISITIRG